VPANAFGIVQYPLDFGSLTSPGIITPGVDWNFLFWFRDSLAGGSNVN
jgi:hypothetical protein